MIMMMVMKMLVNEDDDDGDEYIGNFVDISCKVAKFESFQHSSKLSALLLDAVLKKTFYQSVALTTAVWQYIYRQSSSGLCTWRSSFKPAR